MDQKKIEEIIGRESDKIVEEWVNAQRTALEFQKDLVTEGELKQNAKEFLDLFREALKAGDIKTLDASPWKELKEFTGEIIRFHL